MFTIFTASSATANIGFWTQMIGSFSPVWQSITSGFPVLFIHLGTATLVWLCAMFIYTAITPMKEFTLIRQGNSAAALSMGAAAMGLALPLGFCLASSVNIWDIILWGSISLILQLIAFRIVHLVLGNLSDRIEKGEMSAAIFLTMVILSLAILNAAAIS